MDVEITTIRNLLLSTVVKQDEIFTTTEGTSAAIDRPSFLWYDYVLFTIMLILSALIGIYFGCFGKKQQSTSEYLLGGKNMGVFPISMSLVASMISGITLLAVPADIYAYGITYWLTCASYIIVAFSTIFIYLPVFYKCELTSTFEYLQLRFHKKIRTMCSLMYTLNMILYLPIVVFIPALAFSQATGINIHYITPVVCSVCIFYTTIGGLKAVVWTDTLQFTAMIGAIIAVIFIGTKNIGGVAEVFRIAGEGERLHIDFDVSMYKRDTFWSAFVGLTVGWISLISVSQGPIQKFLALGSMKNSKITMVIFGVGMFLVTSSSVYTGLLMYATYKDCDLLTSNQVKQHDQILPYYVLDIAASIPGLSGLFIAGLFCASLSTLSAAMNSLAGTIFEDFISPFLPKNTSEFKIGSILKIIVIVIGIISTALVFIVEKLGGLLPLVISLTGITNGAITALFTIGMLIPMVNTTGAFVGTIVSVITMLWMVVGAQYYKAIGKMHYATKPMSTEGCEYPYNITLTTDSHTPTSSNDEDIFFFYRISHYYYIVLGMLIVILVAVPVSYLTKKKTDKPVNRDYISPIMQWAVKEDDLNEYYSVQKAKNVLTVHTG